MRRIRTIIVAAFVMGIIQANTEEKHEHKTIPGPLGGKVLEIGGSHVEFFVQVDRKVQVKLYDPSMKPLSPAEHSISVIAQAPAGKVDLAMEKKADGWHSSKSLPDGSGYMTILQFKADATAKPVNLRIKLDLGLCGGCKRAEYACVCEGHAH